MPTSAQARVMRRGQSSPIFGLDKVPLCAQYHFIDDHLKVSSSLHSTSGDFGTSSRIRKAFRSGQNGTITGGTPLTVVPIP